MLLGLVSISMSCGASDGIATPAPGTEITTPGTEVTTPGTEITTPGTEVTTPGDGGDRPVQTPIEKPGSTPAGNADNEPVRVPVTQRPAEPADKAHQNKDRTSATGVVGDGSGSVRFVSQNILHGIACPPDSDACALPARIGLFMDQLVRADCPEMVSIQEVSDAMVTLISKGARECDYEVVWDGDPGLDREVVLTTLRVIDSRRWVLADRFRSAYLVRVASPIGVVDFLTAHLASGEDRPCSIELCPPPCDPSERLRECQARQVLEIAREVAVPSAVTVLGGDLNATPEQSPIRLLTGNGFVDSHLAAGRGECRPSTGEGCTAGRDSESLKDMADPSSRQRLRIDYLFYSAADRDCSTGPGTGLFNAEPEVGPLAFPSDHTAVMLTLECSGVADDPLSLGGNDAGAGDYLIDLPTTAPHTPPVGRQPDDDAAAAITAAFETFLDGSDTDVDLRAGLVEDSPGVRRAALDMFSRSEQVAAEATGRVESIRLTSNDTAEVTYSILLSGQVVMAGRVGKAVLVDGEWLISKSTFCDLAGIAGQAVTVDACG